MRTQIRCGPRLLTSVEYGNPFCVMGWSGTHPMPAPHHSVRIKEKLEWLLPTNIYLAQPSINTYEIQPQDVSTQPTMPAAVKIRKGSDNYWVELREQIPNGSNGSVVLMRADDDWTYTYPMGFQQSQMVDTDPDSVRGTNPETEQDAAFEVGQWVCLPGGLCVRLESYGTSGSMQTANIEVENADAPVFNDLSSLDFVEPSTNLSKYGSAIPTFSVEAQGTEGIQRIEFYVLRLYVGPPPNCPGEELPIPMNNPPPVAYPPSPYSWQPTPEQWGLLQNGGYSLLARSFSTSGQVNTIGTFTRVDKSQASW